VTYDLLQCTYPLITCGITSFNAADSIERAVRSALSQTYRPIEIVVVDDASSDGSEAILRRLAAEHEEVRVFAQRENLGVAAARNRIVEEARGEFVAFFDDDDESLPDRLSLQFARISDYERLMAITEPVICHTARLIQYPSGLTQIWRSLGENVKAKAPQGPAVARALFCVGAPLRDRQSGAAATCSQMARARVYRELGGFDPGFRRSEDDDLIVRAALANAHFIGVATPLVHQWLTPTSDKSLNTQRQYARKLLEKHKAFLGRSYGFARSYYEARFALMAGRHVELAFRLLGILMTHPVVAIRRISAAIHNFALHRRMGRLYIQAGSQQ
jgi:glycosyltransferase involved in cell wall biosynthesis